MRYSLSIAVAAVGLMTAGCGDSSDTSQAGAPSTVIDAEATPETLAAWNLFAEPANQVPAPGVVAYEMRNPLFTDYAAKHRYMYVPEGTQITYHGEDAWQFPLGTVLVKTFAYPLDEGNPAAGERLIETRLLAHREGGWEPEVYVWNEAGTEATRDVTGDVLPVTRTEADGTQTTFDYGVPTRDECRKCHGSAFPIEGATVTRALGPMTGQLNYDVDFGDGPENQIDRLAALGLLDTTPPPAAERLLYPDPADEQAPVAERARGYLTSNCAHCHSEGGEVFDKELFLDWASTDPAEDPFRWGVCKKPTSAGNAECESTLDIVPGDADSSLLVCRMESLGKGKMAPLGRSLGHTEGIALIREWINGLELPSCTVE